MAHFAVFAPPLRGHFRPLSILAEELIARGHQASFFHQEEARRLVEAPGAQFVQIAHDAPSVESWTRPMSKIRGLLGLADAIKRMETFTTNFCREAPRLIAAKGIDDGVAAVAPNNYVEVRGTSFAAPIIAMMFADMEAPDPVRAQAELAKWKGHANDLGKPGRDDIYGEGELGDNRDPDAGNLSKGSH